MSTYKDYLSVEIKKTDNDTGVYSYKGGFRYVYVIFRFVGKTPVELEKLARKCKSELEARCKIKLNFLCIFKSLMEDVHVAEF